MKSNASDVILQTLIFLAALLMCWIIVRCEMGAWTVKVVVSPKLLQKVSDLKREVLVAAASRDRIIDMMADQNMALKATNAVLRAEIAELKKSVK